MKNISPITKEYLENGYSKTCPIIDMHTHFGPFYRHHMPAANINKMIEILKKCGVKRIVSVPHQSFSDAVYGNSIMQEVIDSYPEYFLGYWCINPNYQDIIKRDLSNFDKFRGFVGFKFIPDYHTYPLTGLKYKPVLEFANEHKLLILVHTWGGSSFNSPQMVLEIAKEYPDVRFIMGHSGYGDWELSVSIARDLPNVYLELTAVYVAHDFSMLPGGSGTPVQLLSCLSVNGIIEYMVGIASSKKIVFGTDLPWYSPHFAAGAILFARIGDEQNMIFYIAMLRNCWKIF